MTSTMPPPPAAAPRGDEPATVPATASVALRSVELTVTGMTCASCSSRVERKLNRLPGVSASVNYATGLAHVEMPEDVTVDTLVATVESAGYGAFPPAAPESGAAAADSDAAAPGVGTGRHDVAAEAEAARADSLRRRLIVCGALAAPVLLLTMVPALQFPLWQWLAFYLATAVVAWGAWPFHRAAFVNLTHGTFTMDTLVSLGVLAAWLWSAWALFFGGAGEPGYTMTWNDGSHPGHPHLYLEVAAVVPVFILAGRWFEARAKRRSGAALRSLLDLGAKEATRLVGADAAGRGGVEQPVPAESLAVGDLFVVRPGEKIATDGVVVAGTSAVDASLLTGESVPVEVGPGSEVTGATINAGGRLVVRATRVGSDTTLAQMGRLVQAAQTGKAPVQRLADRISGIFVPVVLFLALETLTVWYAWTGDVQSAFTAAVAVLVIACPCALGLAVPTALLVGTGRGAQRGVLIKGPEVLEDTRRVDTIVLDKTGTITAGVMRVVDVVPVADVTEHELLSAVAALEHTSTHPVARAIVTAAVEQLGLAGPEELPAVEDAHTEAGLGVTGSLAGRSVAAGRPSWLASTRGVDATADPALAAAVERATATGGTVVAVAAGSRALGVITLADTIRPTSAAAVAQLRELGLRPILLTGNNSAAAHAVAGEVGISEVISDVLPEEKVAVVRDLQAQGRVVAMVGDGVNDAAALATADLGIAMGAGSDVAIEASDLTLVRNDLVAAADAIRLSRATLRTIKVNMFWAFGYNVAMIPLAMAGLMNPMLAGAAMACSSVFVVSNSLRLRKFR